MDAALSVNRVTGQISAIKISVEAIKRPYRSAAHASWIRVHASLSRASEVA
jgi:hypothetical protein